MQNRGLREQTFFFNPFLVCKHTWGHIEVLISIRMDPFSWKSDFFFFFTCMSGYVMFMGSATFMSIELHAHDRSVVVGCKIASHPI